MSKIYKILFPLIILFSFSNPIHSIANTVDQVSIADKLEQCLQTCWGVDAHTAAYIREKFKPLIENDTHHSVIEKFIALSQKQNINFRLDKKIQPLPIEDGTLQSPKEHVIVFENPYLRILWGSTEPLAREAFHTHAWRSVMVIIKPTKFEIEYPNGTKEIVDYPVGAFELPAGEKYACTNLGNTADESLRFEIKE